MDVVRAPANPAAITPAKVADAVELTLPNPADAVCLGGNGRYVIYRVPKSKVAVVLDVCEGRFVKSVPIQEEGTLIAAGNEHLYLVSPKANVIVRWNLATLKKEATYPNPHDATPHAALMGHATDGPLLLVGAGPARPGLPPGSAPGHAVLIDGLTGKAVDWPAGGPGHLAEVASARGTVPLRVSADGRVYGYSSSDGRAGTTVLDPTVKGHATDALGTPVLPGPDGTLFTTRGLFAPDGTALVSAKVLVDIDPGRNRHNLLTLPPAHGRAFLTFDIDGIIPGDGKPEKTAVALWVAGEDRPVARLDRLATFVALPNIPWQIGAPIAGALALPDCVTLVPDAKAVVLLDKTFTVVRVEPLDLNKLFADATFDILLLTSHPPVATRGAAFVYKPAVMSKRGGVKLTLDGGPPGMTVTADGALAWDVPADFAGDSTFVILTVADAAGQETLHAFPLPVRAKAAKP